MSLEELIEEVKTELYNSMYDNNFYLERLFNKNFLDLLIASIVEVTVDKLGTEEDE